MGTFIGHVAPGLSFTLLGLWHLLNTINSYKLKGPLTFTLKPWFPFTPSSTLKHLELHLILLFSLLAIALNLLPHPTGLESLEHATMFLHLAVYASAAIAADLSTSSDSFTGLITALAASVFAQELFLLHFHSTDHVGLEGHYHWLLQLIVGASIVAVIATIGFPTSFTAAVARSATVVVQGLWFVNMGFVLWFGGFVPSGCHATPEVAVECGTEAAGRRAVALANLQLSLLVAGVSVMTVFLCVRPDWKCTEYRMLHRRSEADSGELKESGVARETV